MHDFPSKIETVFVGFDGSDAGILKQGAYYLYTPFDSQTHVSLTMADGSTDYKSGALHPVFSQNLPEGNNRRFIADKLARFAKVNDMYLLALQGDAGIGLLGYRSNIHLPEIPSTPLDSILTYRGKEPLFPHLLNQYYLRNTLAGVQPKVSIPTDRTVTQKSLIVKTNEDYELLTVNEYVCMQAANRCGLSPSNTYLSDDTNTFVTERFDILEDGTKLGYEDFTVLNRSENDANAKYRGSYEHLLNQTYRYTNSLAEVERMYRYIVFSCLIGNGDAHLKNFALMYPPDRSAVFVSPPFDITHTLIYPELPEEMALKIKGSRSFPQLSGLLELAEGKVFRIRRAKQIVESLAEGILEYLRHSNEVQLLNGLRESIESSVSYTMAREPTKRRYSHLKQRKYP